MKPEYRLTHRTFSIVDKLEEPTFPEGDGWELHSTVVTEITQPVSCIHILWTWKREPALRVSLTPAYIRNDAFCCEACFKASGRRLRTFMIACSKCGNKRCPKSSDHRYKCTGSNKPDQVGTLEEEGIEADE